MKGKEEEVKEEEEAEEEEEEEEEATRKDAAALLEDARNSSGGSADFISLDKLVELREAFELADADGGGGLDQKEFLTAFGSILGEGMSPQQLTNLFMKIDANSDGSVDWPEFTEYMLLENRGSELMKKAAPKCEYVCCALDSSEAKERHSKTMTRVRFFQELGVYATCSEDGSVRLWQSHSKLKHMRTIFHKPGAVCNKNQGDSKEDLEPKKEKSICPARKQSLKSQPWCNDACYMHASGTLAVATSDRTISFYDTSMGYECVGRIRPMINAPILLEYYCGPLSDEREVLICADDQGYLHVWHLERNDFVFHDTVEQVERRADPPKGVYGYFRHKVHEDRINQLEYSPSIGAILTASSDGSVALSDLEKSRVLRTFCGHGTKHVYTFSYVANIKLVASTGSDRQILFWNPYTMAIAHEICDKEVIDSPLIKLALNAKEHQLISLSTLGIVRVWDLSAFSCIGVLEHQQQGPSPETFHEMLFDARNKHLLLAGRTLALKQAKMQAVAARKSHQWSVMDAQYNSNFYQLVSASAYEVHVWDVGSGQITFRFVNPHGTSSLTAMCFDVGGRRLLTGAHDGTIKMWNFNNGACLGNFSKTCNGQPLANISEADDDREVASIISFTDGVQQGNGHCVEHEYIVATGRDRRVFAFSENKRQNAEYSLTCPLPHQVPIAHMDDVNSVVHCGDNKVATAGDDGRIIVWSLLSGIIKQRIGHSVTARKQLDTQAKKSQTKQKATTTTTTSAPADLLLLKAKHFGESYAESSLSSENDTVDDPTTDDDDDINDIGRIRSLIRKTTIADLGDVKKLAIQRAKEHNIPPRRITWQQMELEKVKDKTPQQEQQEQEQQQHMPLSAREGKQLAEQAAQLERIAKRAEKKKKMRGVPQPDRIAAENLLYLERIDCLLSSGSDGFLRFWNQHEGNMLMQLDPLHAPDESIVAIATDTGSDTLLFVGDTDGWISVWDISKLRPPPHTERDGLKIRNIVKWQAHTNGAMVNIVYIALPDKPKLVVTTCTDGTVFLWTIQGRKIGMFGQELPWSLTRPRTWQSKKQAVLRNARNITSCVKAMQNEKSNSEHTEQTSRQYIAHLERRNRCANLNKVDQLKVLKTRVKNKYKLNYLDQIKNDIHRLEQAPQSAAQMLLEQASKSKRRAKPSEMPPKPSLRTQLAQQQIMQRVPLPPLQPITFSTKIHHQ